MVVITLGSHLSEMIVVKHLRSDVPFGSAWLASKNETCTKRESPIVTYIVYCSRVAGASASGVCVSCAGGARGCCESKLNGVLQQRRFVGKGGCFPYGRFRAGIARSSRKQDTRPYADFERKKQVTVASQWPSQWPLSGLHSGLHSGPAYFSMKCQ